MSLDNAHARASPQKVRRTVSALADLMNTVAGRAVRVILGLALIYIGLMVMGGTTGMIVAVVGLVPVLLGATGRCVLEMLPG